MGFRVRCQRANGRGRRHIVYTLPSVWLLCAWGVACGGTDSQTPSTGDGHSQSMMAIASSASSSQRYLNDGDKDRVYDEEGPVYRDNSRDDDKDPAEDYQRDDNGDYHDRDDMTILHFGRPAGPVDRWAILAFVRRYYAAAVAGDGAAACSMLPPGVANTVPKDYGGEGTAGPPYLRGAKTCPDVMRLLFEHARSELTGRFVLTGVRIDGDHAYALLGSTDRPAGYIGLERVGGAWRVAGLIGSAMP
jgi:hypothetical protein